MNLEMFIILSEVISLFTILLITFGISGILYLLLLSK